MVAPGPDRCNTVGGQTIGAKTVEKVLCHGPRCKAVRGMPEHISFYQSRVLERASLLAIAL